MSNTYTLENATSRHELTALANRLTDEQLSHPLEAGWTAASVFAHLAFWDQRALILIHKWQNEGVTPSPIDVDVINEVTRPLFNAMLPRVAVQLVIATAEAVDKAIEQLAPEFIAKIETDGKTVRLNRALHRRDHIAQIEQAVGQN
jgi:hypothetical protein